MAALTITDLFGGKYICQREARDLGLKRYFTGRPCKNGHVSERFTRSSACVMCRSVERGGAGLAPPMPHLGRKRVTADGLPASWSEARRVGARYYFTGLPCKHGHIAPRATATSNCSECKLIASKAMAPRYYSKQEEWRKANPEKSRAICKRSYVKRGGAATVREIRSRHPERTRAYVLTRQSRMKAGGVITGQDVSQLIERQKGRCIYCKRSFKKVKYHIDHKVPVSRGGRNTPDNIQILCAPCNMRKKALDHIEFAQQLGLLL